jgi:hypothetical protein
MNGGRRDLGALVDPGQVASEAADGHHPSARDGAAGRHGALQRPRQRRGDGHELDVAGVEIVNEPWQQPRGIGKIVAEQAPQPQVVVET